MGLFTEFKKFADDKLGIESGSDLAALLIGGPIGLAVKRSSIGESLEDAFKSVTGQTAQDELGRISEEQAERIGGLGDLLQPQIEAGQRQIPELERAASAGGFGMGIGDLLSGGALDPLIAQRQEASQQALASTGLRRSGTAAREAAKIPADVAFQIEGELNRRRQSLAGGGERGVGQQIDLQTMIAQILAGGQTSGLQARAEGTQNLINFGSKFIPMGGG